jgi:hypothetical protein
MWRIGIAALLACSACRVAPQPESARTVAAYEVPVPTARDRDDLVALLRQEAVAEGFHVDAASPDQLRGQSEVSPITINAAVWRGDRDEEAVASVMDGAGQLGLGWLTFAKSEEPERTARFRTKVMRRIVARWPGTRALPITPSGGIPLHQDLVLTKDGYRVKRAAASSYGFRPSSPLLAGD